jgi:hypothetical protein
MPHYRLHLIEAAGTTLDTEGLYRAAEDVPATALAAARDCLAGEVRAGLVDLRSRIDVQDERGLIVFTQSFADALEIIRH